MRALPRILTPELLDHLPADDPAAIASRRDLARINAVMRQEAILARALSTFPVPAVLADLGGGDGCFLLGLARRLAKTWPNVRAVIADRQDIVSEETRDGFARLGWGCEIFAGDVFDALPSLGADIAIANLFLHHLDERELRRLLEAVAGQVAGFAACEPRRSWLALAGAHLVGLLGANHVTRHDAVASVRAGFAGRELSARWPRGAWHLREQRVLAFTHLFVAHVA
jgi:hypothetical protein